MKLQIRHEHRHRIDKYLDTLLGRRSHQPLSKGVSARWLTARVIIRPSLLLRRCNLSNIGDRVRNQVMLKITLTLTLTLALTLTYTRPPMFDRLQRRNNSHSVIISLILRRRGGLMFCCCFKKYFSDFCQNNYLNIYRTDLT